MKSIQHESSGARPTPSVPTEHIMGKELIAYDIGSDGSRFCLRFSCVNGKQGSLSFPTECLEALIMTPPRMMTQALWARYGDDSLRLVYPADIVQIERSPDPNTFIMTLTTPDGFGVSFSLSGEQLDTLGKARTNT